MKTSSLTSRVASRALGCFGLLFAAYCGGTSSGDTAGQPEVVARTTAALTATRGWVSVGPYGIVDGDGTHISGVGTDVENVPASQVYRMSAMQGGVREWDGTRWVGLMDSLVPANNPPLSSEGLDVNTFATRPGDLNTIVAGTAADAHCYFGSADSGIWLGSKASGSWKWSLVAAPGTVGSVMRIRWSDPQTVHAATTQGYFVSRDAGKTWSQLLTGSFSDLVIAPAQTDQEGAIVYAAKDTVGVYKIDFNLRSGQFMTWPVYTYPKGQTGQAALAASYSEGQTIYCMTTNEATTTSADGYVQALVKIEEDVPNALPDCSTGKTPCFPASKVTPSLPWSRALTVNPLNPRVIIAAGVLMVQTQDGGVTWNSVSMTGFHSDFHGLGWGQDGGYALAVTDGGYFYSGDYGLHWASDSNISQMTALTDFDLEQGGTVMLGSAWDDGLYATTNGGQSWSSVGHDDHVFVLADPNSDQSRFWETDYQGCCNVTSDAGKTWSTCDVPGTASGRNSTGNCGGDRQMHHDRYQHVYSYAQSKQTGGPDFPGPTVYWSSDNGKTWSQYDAQVPEPNGYVSDIGVGRYDLNRGGSYVYAMGSNGKDSSGNPIRGTLWAEFSGGGWVASNPRATGTRDIRRVVAHPTMPSIAYALPMQAGNPGDGDTAQIYVTYNGGQPTTNGTLPWLDITGDLPPSVIATDIVVDPVTNMMFLGTEEGIYRSVNGGSHWERWISGLPARGSQIVLRLHTVDNRPEGGPFLVYAGLWGSGVWYRNGAETEHPAGDFNADGYADIVLTGNGAGLDQPLGTTGLPLALSNGSTSFNYLDGPLDAPSFITFSQQGSRPVVGDFDDDGFSDVALVGGTQPNGTPWGSIPVAFSNGDGSFHVTNLAPSGGGFFPQVATQHPLPPVTGDFDGDGRADIALVGGSYNGVAWNTIPVAYGGSTRGEFGPVTNSAQKGNSQFAALAQAPGAQLVAGDFNGDGLTDLALVGGVVPFVSPWSFIAVAYSTGGQKGTFELVEADVYTTRTGLTESPFPTFAAQSPMVVAGDFNGDGKCDIALVGGQAPDGTPWGSIPVAFSNTNGTFWAINVAETNGAQVPFHTFAQQTGAQLLSGDYNGDGLADLALTGGSSPGGMPWATIPEARSNGNATGSGGIFTASNGWVSTFPQQAAVASTYAASASQSHR